MKRISIFLIAVVLIAGMVGCGQLTYKPTIDSTADTELLIAESSALDAYGKLPILFIENQGQVDEAVRYYVKTSGQTVYFTEESIVFDLIGSDGAEGDDVADRLVFSLDFLGANSLPAIEGMGKDSAVVNYFIGDDPDNWYAGVPTYREVVYRDVYPGIDLRLYGSDGMLRYDFVVNPGAAPETIALAYNGIDSLTIMDGELIVSTAFGDMVQSQPYMYQQIGDEVVEIEGHFKLGSDNTYGFHVTAYNSHYPLIIDPVLLDYSTYLGGEYADAGNGIAVDSSGNAYITGSTNSYPTTFPITPGAFQTAFAGFTDAFIAKLAPAGNALVYCTYLGGEDFDVGNAIAVDSSGRAYVTGYTWSKSPGFPTTAGAFQTAWAGGYDAFVTKLAPAGNALVYSTYLGGVGDDAGNGIAVDSSGNAYVTGYTFSASPGFPTTAGAFRTASPGGRDAFVTKLAPTGNTLGYSTYLGSQADDAGNSIAVDSDGNAFVTGYTFASSFGFPTTSNAVQKTSAGGGDAFVTKLAPAGTGVRYSTYLGGEGDDEGNGIAVDSQGNAYITGHTTSYSPGFPTTAGAFQKTSAGGGDAFVTKLTPAGDAVVYSTYLGAQKEDWGRGIAVDSDSHAYVTGYTLSSSPRFPTTTDAFQTTHAGGYVDAFVTKLTPAGNALVYSTYLGGEESDEGHGIALDSDNHAYVTGYTVSSSPGFPTTAGAFQTANAGAGFTDVFVAKIVAPCDLTSASTAGGTVTTPGVGNHAYEKGTVINLVATPNAGYQFAGWTGDVGSITDDEDATTTITMNGDYSITANFMVAQLTQYHLTIMSQPGGTVTTPATGTHTYEAGTAVNLVATPNAGYQFAGWTGDVGTIANHLDATTTVTMNGDYTIVANFWGGPRVDWFSIGLIIAAVVVVVALVVFFVRRRRSARAKGS